MTSLANAIQNNALAALSQNAPRGIMSAIKTASHKTGVNFAYMVQQANAESSFTADAKAKTSSASGLYQFIESTWMSMVDRYGAKHGIETDGKTRGEILELRNDPRAASLMAAEFAGENQNFLQNHTKGEVGSTELYFAHFLGAGKAAAFLNAHDEDPNQKAALLFPKAAKANRSIFYDQASGRAKSLDEVYAHFDKKFSIEDVKTADIKIASAPNSLYNKPPAMNSYVMKSPSYNAMQAYQDLVASPLEIMMLAQLDLPTSSNNSKKDSFSLFSMQSLYR